MKLKKISIFLICLAVALSSCSFFKKEPRVKGTPEGLYSRGSTEYQDASYKKAREYFQRLKEEYPLHDLALLAELGIADSYFSDKEYSEAESAYTDFISLHPTNENIPYAIYQMGMCHYNQIGSIDRDQTETIRARKEFERLTARFPESKFSMIAEKLSRECKQKIAEHEFYVGEYYLKQKKYQAALNRFETITRDYANVGLDYKVAYFIAETKLKIAEEEKKERENERAKLEKLNAAKK
jgi:outer membrane protein assembly factor BamD